MSEKFGLDPKIGFQNTFFTKCINVINDSIGPLIILRSIVLPGAAREVVVVVAMAVEVVVEVDKILSMMLLQIHLYVILLV